MAQIEPIDAYLGPARTGLAIGATLYQLDGSTVHAAFATTGWYEAPAGSGAWHHAGLSLPDAGGVVAVGISGTEYMRVAVGAARPLATDYTATRAAKLDNLDAAVTTRATPAQVNTEADQALADVGMTTTVTGRIDAAVSSRLASAGYTAPDNTTIGTINTRLGAPVGASISADIAGVQSDTNDIQARIPAALVGGRIDANIGAISSDATAADNAEAFFDGTGYAGTGNVIPTVTTVTNAVSANVTQISGDSTAADNLEAALDGTGGVTITAGLTGNVTGNLSGSVGSVTAGVSLTDGAITAAKIAADAITAAKIADGAIDAATFATGAITASAIAADAITDAKVASDVTIAAVTGAVGSVTAGVTVTTNNDKTGYGLADGAITTAKFGVGAITAAVIATDAIDADALAADAVSEIQSGLATAAALATVDTVVDAILVDTAEIGAAGAGLTALATQASVNTIDDFLDTEIAAIKAKTDNLPASPAATGDIPDVAAIATAVWANATRSLTTFGTLAADVWAVATRTITGGTVTTNSDKEGYSLSTAGIQAIWDALTSALTTVGSIGKRIADNLDATINSRATPANVTTAQAAIEAAITALNDLSTADIDARLTAYDGTTQADLTATQTAITNAITALNNLSQAQAQAAATAALNAYDPPTKAELDSAIDALPTAAEVWSYNSRTLTASSNSITIVSAVNANTVTVFAKDTWSFTIFSSALDLASYEAIGFVAKASAGQSDSDALLYVRSDTGLTRIGGTSATAGDGTLTIIDATSFSVKIAIGATGVAPGTYRWWVKGFDTTPATDEGYTLATGVFIVNPAGLQAVS